MTADAVVAAAAKAPVKDSAMLVENIAMARTLARACAGAAHVINISSDAVYGDFAEPISESSLAAPTTLHGVMHLARELTTSRSTRIARTVPWVPTPLPRWTLAVPSLRR